MKTTIGKRAGTVFVSIVLAGLGVCHAQSDESAKRIFDLTNQDRQEHGLQTLHWDAALAAAAQTHVERMIRESTLSHQYPGEAELMTRASQAGAHFQAIAENVAMGPNPEAIEKEWMQSNAHRTNILDPKMNAIGVGVAGRGGSVYAVEDFAEAAEALSKDEVEHRVGELLRAQSIDPSAPADAAEQACSAGHGIPAGAKSLVRFQTPDLQQLPSQVVQQIRAGHFARAAVGACAPEANQANFTTYRVAILFY